MTPQVQHPDVAFYCLPKEHTPQYGPCAHCAKPIAPGQPFYRRYYGLVHTACVRENPR